MLVETGAERELERPLALPLAGPARDDLRVRDVEEPVDLRLDVAELDCRLRPVDRPVAVLEVLEEVGEIGVGSAS